MGKISATTHCGYAKSVGESVITVAQKKEKRRLYMKRWRELHPQYHKQHRNPEKQREANKRYRERHPEKIKARRQANREYYRKHSEVAWNAWRNAARIALGDKCVMCGIADPRVLQIDHINGGGNKERKLGGHKYRQKILAHLEDYQILCANCNWIKKFERNE